MLLILPVFLTMVFTIMEMGHLAFWVIVVNHATYEVSRIGSMLATRKDGTGPRDVTPDMQNFMSRIIATARVASRSEETVYDLQAEVMNHDLIVTGSYDVRLIFPISNFLLANPRGSGMRTVSATVRMPIERPLQKGSPEKAIGKGGVGKFPKS